MSAPAIEPRAYSRLSVGLHWLMLVLLVAVYATILLRHEYPRGSDIREALKAWHFSLGLSVFGLVLLRAAARRLHPPSPESGFGARMAGLMHLALYVYMIAMPLMGWVILSAEGDPVRLFGLPLPPLVAPDEGLAGRVEDVHEAVGALAYWLVGLHAVAALFHHYVLRDGTLRRMTAW